MTDARRALARALVARGGPGSRIVDAIDRGWASLLFEGSRHTVRIELPADAAERFVDGIGEAAFALAGHIVADIVVVDRVVHGATALVRIEALTLVDA